MSAKRLTMPIVNTNLNAEEVESAAVVFCIADSFRRELAQVVNSQLFLDRNDLIDGFLKPLVPEQAIFLRLELFAEFRQPLVREHFSQGRKQNCILTRLVRAVHANERLARRYDFRAGLFLTEPIRHGGSQNHVPADETRID